MPRPPVEKTIPADLSERVFKPRGLPASRAERVELSLDGLEALRLVDLEGLYQEAAAERMGVSRATLSRVLEKARRAVALALVEERMLVVEGGDVRRSRRKRWPCPVHGQGQRRGRGCRCGGRHGKEA